MAGVSRRGDGRLGDDVAVRGAPALITLGPLLALLALLAAAAPADAQATAPTDTCAACHLETGEDRLVGPAKQYVGDIHRAKGFGCVACHGGDATEAGPEAMDPKKGFVSKPDRRQLIQMCGRCHSDAQFMKRYNPSLGVDQVKEYWTSVHGRRLSELNDPKVATCASCHPAHSIKPPSDPGSSVHPRKVADTCGRCHADAVYMAGYKITTDQLAKYMQSVHWKTMAVNGDLAAPTCNDCHGTHGAAPPGVSWVGSVCGQCHTVMGELFGKSVHAKVFAEMGAPGCATCHENHAIRSPSDEMLGVTGQAVCVTCHAADDKGGRSAVEMRGLIDSLRSRYDRARDILTTAEHAGMEVSQAQFDLNGAKDALVKARTAVHAFNVEAVQKESEAGLVIADRAQKRGERALADLKFRRAGLGVSLVIILALVAGVLLKIRQLDRGGE